VEKIKRHTREWHGGNRQEIREIMFELFETGQILRHRIQSMELEKVKKIKSIISQAGKDIREVIAQ